MVKNKTINIQGSEISIVSQKEEDFISLTDMAKSQMQEAVIIKWLSLKSTIEYVGEWEALYNPNLIIPNSVQLKMPVVATILFCQ